MMQTLSVHSARAPNTEGPYRTVSTRQRRLIQKVFIGQRKSESWLGHDFFFFFFFFLVVRTKGDRCMISRYCHRKYPWGRGVLVSLLVSLVPMREQKKKKQKKNDQRGRFFFCFFLFRFFFVFFF